LGLGVPMWMGDSKGMTEAGYTAGSYTPRYEMKKENCESFLMLIEESIGCSNGEDSSGEDSNGE